MSTTTPTLKISKRMAELLTAAFPEGSTREKIEAEVQAGRADKLGAVRIEVNSPDLALYHGYALGRIGKLDAELATADEANRHKLLGEHSAWRALVRQVAPLHTPAAP